MGLKVNFTEVVTKWIKNREKVQQAIDSYASDISWNLSMSLKQTDNGTRMALDLDYKLPYSWLGKLLDLLFVRRYLRKGLNELNEVCEDYVKTLRAQSQMLISPA